MKVVRALAVATVLAAGAGQLQAAEVTNPDWLRRPDAQDMTRVYPDLAATLLVTGRAVVGCRVDTEGRARNCVVLDERPAGLGFGAAALELTGIFRFLPKRVDGRPVPGGPCGSRSASRSLSMRNRQRSRRRLRPCGLARLRYRSNWFPA